MQDAQIPRFFLYGEAPRSVGERFLHLEAIEDRTRPADWNIRPHTHTGLSHIFHVTHGGGVMSADALRLPFQAPCLMVVPSNVVHGFAYELETRGAVLTVSDVYRDELVRRETELRRVFAQPRILALAEEQVFTEALERLGRELAWSAPGHAAAVEALLITLLVETLRLTHHAEVGDEPLVDSQAGLVARFRALVEERYRSEAQVEGYASALKVSAKRLRAACLRAAAATPGRMIQDRRLLEAKRILLYTNMSVAEAAYYLGYDDPAYFTRTFTKNCGRSPRAFRSDPNGRTAEP
ncbi:MAG: helix-turn-helix domain-containing protein [Pseudomonadota bacterium]|uniref:helix-turn-helix domain-containing protein n=1 Tax=Phenylobacterium sp. TaxID=1871053 RepID=UPI0025CCAB13|nr:helix-turn-helix domain-containing protein [Phenylobacterium sp.]MBT9470069.1 helix-turn-helix domain-containing protein [Phenylobacterium sp.]